MANPNSGATNYFGSQYGIGVSGFPIGGGLYHRSSSPAGVGRSIPGGVGIAPQGSSVGQIHSAWVVKTHVDSEAMAGPVN